MDHKHFVLKMTDSVGTENLKVFHSFQEAKKGFIDEFKKLAPVDAPVVENRYFGEEPTVSIDSSEEIIQDETFHYIYDFRVERDDNAQTLEFYMCSTPNGSSGCGCGDAYEIDACIMQVE